MHTLSADICYWLAISHLEGVGPVRLRHWLEYFKDIKELFTASVIDLQSAGLTQKQIYAIKALNWKNIHDDLEWCEKSHCHLIPYVHESYPPLLKEIPSPPMMLYVLGEIKLLLQPQLAIVGSRNPTVTGYELAKQFAFSLTQSGLTITSGLAIGIDVASHRGALHAGGKTIAVLGSGFKQIYPRLHKKLAEEIIANGTLVSEFSPQSPAKSHHFPMRNRIISGLSLGVLVVEAALRSGSLITASFAVDQGREVFALPGSVHNPLARGCHKLIREGAKLVETANDILEELGALKTALYAINKTFSKPEVDVIYQQLLTKIGYEATSLDAIIIRSGLTANEVSSMLLALELKGYVTLMPGGYVRNV